MAVNHLSLCGNYQQLTCKSMNSSSQSWLPSCTYEMILLSKPSSHDTFPAKGTFWAWKLNIREQYISFSVSGQRAGIYIKNRQASRRKKLLAFIFPAQGETGRARRRGKLGVSFSNSIAGTFGSKVIVWSCDLDRRCYKSLMKSASNPLPMCHLWSDNMMDGPFYSLFHLLCCSKLYFPFPGCFYLKHPFLCDMVVHQGSGSNVPRLSEGWEEMHKPQQSSCISSLDCQFQRVLLKDRKTLEMCTHDARLGTRFQLR